NAYSLASPTNSAYKRFPPSLEQVGGSPLRRRRSSCRRGFQFSPSSSAIATPVDSPSAGVRTLTGGDFRRRTAMPAIHLARPGERAVTGDGRRKASARLRQRAGQGIRMLRRRQERRQKRRRREIGDAGMLADEIPRRLQLGLDAIERGDDLLAPELRAGVVDAHVHAEYGTQRGERDAVYRPHERRALRRHQRRRVVRVRQHVVEDAAAQAWPELL